MELEEVTLELLPDQVEMAAEEPAQEAEMEPDKLEPMD